MEMALPRIGTLYSSTSKEIGVLTEAWAMMNLFCPACAGYLNPQTAGTRAVDFRCSRCAEEYQLKSGHGPIKTTVLGAKYQTTLVRVIQRTHPSIFFLNYDRATLHIHETLFIHRASISEDFVIRRMPLSNYSRRAGYQGCIFNLGLIPDDQKLWIVKNEVAIERPRVHEFWKNTNTLLQQQPSAHIWLVDVLNLVLVLPKEFALQDCYEFETYLRQKHPNNKHIRDKIRQQLQHLRNLGLIEFLGQGKYRRL
jgi:type II restriction enzyme